jgi:hypothetical protein
MSKDILTLQFGSFSNSIGAHFWNAQDELFSSSYGFESINGLEVDPGILFSHGEDSATGRATYTPRLLVFDIASSDGLARAAQGGSFGASGLRRKAMFGEGNSNVGQRGKMKKKDTDDSSSSIASLVDSYARSQMPRNKFLEYLDEEDRENNDDNIDNRNDANNYQISDFGDVSESVNCWGDYLKPRLHSSSLVGVGGRSNTGDSLGPASAALTGGTAQFDAFTDGAFLMCEALEERSRKFLEASDFLQGIVSCVDLDSGFGSLAVEYLYYLRDQCPHTPMLVFGAVAPPSISMSSVPYGAAAGAFDYSGKDRETLRDINVGLAFASFASSASAKDLDATFIPLINPMFDSSLSSSLSSSSSHSTGRIAFEASAPLALAWDSFTLPFRRSTIYSDSVLPVAEMEIDRSTNNCHSSASSTLAVRHDGHVDSRQRSRGGEGVGSKDHLKIEMDESIEYSGEAPVASISSTISMGGFLSLLTPAPYLRLATASLCFPFSQPRSTASMLQHSLSLSPPLHSHSPSFSMPISWTSAKIPFSWRNITDKNSIRRFASPLPSQDDDDNQHYLLDDEGLPQDLFPAPLAHALIMRGVGSHAVSKTGGGGSSGLRYSSSIDGYGRVLDNFMSRTQCRTAGHAIFRTPIPIPLTLPTSLFPDGVYDVAGALASSTSREGGGSGDGIGSKSGVSVPFSSPALLHVACTPAFAPNLEGVLQRFKRGARDRHSSVVHRYERGFDSMRHGGASLGLEESENSLASLLDDYSK